MGHWKQGIQFQNLFISDNGIFKVIGIYLLETKMKISDRF